MRLFWRIGAADGGLFKCQIIQRQVGDPKEVAGWVCKVRFQV